MEMNHVNGHGPPVSLPILIYGRESLIVHWHQNLTAEYICGKAAQEYGISFLGSNMFALYDEKTSQWLHPAKLIGRDMTELRYRIRFHTSTNINTLEENVVHYMFAQYRHLFLEDRLMSGTLRLEESLGLMVLDLVRYAREENIPISKVVQKVSFTKFLPRSVVARLNVWEKRNLRRKVKKNIRPFESDTREVLNFKIMYMVSLIEEYKSFGEETIQTLGGDYYTVSAFKGIQKQIGTDGTKEVVMEFVDIIDTNIHTLRGDQEGFLVLVNRRSGRPLTFEVPDKEKAESIVALLDGYYRLLEDYYHYICLDVAPPSLVNLVRNRCHGPISLSKAKQKIEQSGGGSSDGIYLIRQNPEDFTCYCLTVQLQQKIRNFKINIYSDGSIGLQDQPKFPSLKSFIDHYRHPDNCWCFDGPLRRSIPFQSKEDCLRMVDFSMIDLPTVPEEPAIEWFKTEDMPNQGDWQKLGSGYFTDVYLGTVKKRNAQMRVAIKRPQKDISQTIQQKFSQSVDAMASWKNPYIIGFKGIGAGYTLIMEYASYGPLDKYLKDNRLQLSQRQQLFAAVQLIDALEYLESRRIVHGNVRAHNVLVFRGVPKICVKLGDPMMSVYYHSLMINDRIKQERIRWTAPELCKSNAEPTLEGDKWSYGITLWEIMTCGEKPCAQLSDQEALTNFRQGRRLMKPRDCHELIYKIMEQCWLHHPASRPQCKAILRDLNTIISLLCTDDSDEYYYNIDEDELEPEMIPEDLESLNGDANAVPSLEESQNKANAQQDFSNSDGMTNPQGAMGMSGFAPTFESIFVPFSDLKDFFQEFDIDDDEFMYSAKRVTFPLIDNIPEAKLKFHGKLGQGHFGMVLKGKLEQAAGCEIDVAVKVMKKERGKEGLESFEDEIAQLSRCSHKNIVKVLGFCETTSESILQLVMEYVPLGSLDRYMQKNKTTIQFVTMYLFGQQICQGMAYLGEQKMVHRDLAARNILVASEHEIKISDFGLARNFGEKDYYKRSNRPMELPIKWHAPECIDRGRFSVYSDVWSFGIVLWEMFSYGEVPLYKYPSGDLISMDKLCDALHSGICLSPPANCPRDITEMMLSCWRVQEQERPPFRTLEGRLGTLL